MSRTTVHRTIKAPKEKVFQTVSQIQNFSKAIPDITKVEMLSDGTSGVGTRFRETRLMRGREASTVLEVTEYEENERVRLVADAGGTIWDTVFSVKEKGSDTQLTMVMDAKPYRILARLFTPLMKGMLRKALERDMDAVKVHCEG